MNGFIIAEIHIVSNITVLICLKGQFLIEFSAKKDSGKGTIEVFNLAVFFI